MLPSTTWKIERKNTADSAFFSTLESYRSRLHRYARRSVNSLEAAEDVVQETLLCALRSRNTFDSQKKLGTWLFGILNNQIKNFYARTSREQNLLYQALCDASLGTTEGCPDPGDLAVAESEARALHDALRRLPKKLAEPIHLYYFRGHDVRSLAGSLGISEQNAKVRLYRGRKALERILRA